MLENTLKKSKSIIKKRCLTFLEWIGKYSPFNPEDIKLIQQEPVFFRGDLPKSAGKEFNQYRIAYKQPMPLQENAGTIVYTPAGMAWQDGGIVERWSVQQPAVKHFFQYKKPKPHNVFDNAFVCQAATPYTYGDWISEHIMSLVRALPLDAPLLLPMFLSHKSYVQRDLKELGIKWLSVNEPVQVNNATVIHKTRFSHYVTSEECRAFRKAFNVSPLTPRANSIVYLSRHGQQCEGVLRAYPSNTCELAMAKIGAKIVRTEGLNPADYKSLETEVETVVTDFGSAYLNLLYWNTKNLIVFFTDDWWDGCALFLSQSLGIENIAQLRVDMEMTEEQIADKVKKYLREFKVDV